LDGTGNGDAAIRLGVFVAALLLSACEVTVVVSHDEVARAPSPDGIVDAVLVETNAGATTSFGYEVHIVPRGGSPSASSQTGLLYGAIRSESAYGANLKWIAPDILSIEYLSAESATLNHPSTSVQGRRITAQLVSGISDPTAPPGGMLYNLQGRPHDRK
jgi:hypothetical protein